MTGDSIDADDENDDDDDDDRRRTRARESMALSYSQSQSQHHQRELNRSTIAHRSTIARDARCARIFSLAASIRARLAPRATRDRADDAHKI